MIKSALWINVIVLCVIVFSLYVLVCLLPVYFGH
jgi:hypothetical protein